MQPYDVLMIVVLVGATVFGAIKGMAWQVASIASLVVSYIVSLSASAPLANALGWGEKPWGRFGAMLIIYVFMSFIIWSAFRVVSGFIDRLKLKEFDRQIGALFGVAKGVLLCTAITLFAVTLVPDDAKQRILDSRSGYYICDLLDRADTIMPPELHEVVGPYIRRAQDTLHSGSSHPGHSHSELVPAQIPVAAETLRKGADALTEGADRFGNLQDTAKRLHQEAEQELREATTIR